MTTVVDDLIAADDSEMLVMSMLRGQDLRDAKRYAELAVEAVERQTRPAPELQARAYQALGNAYEDLAFVARLDPELNYREAEAAFTKALALEVARKGVTVNTISPGYIGTKMVMAIPQEVLDSKIIPQIPMGRLGKPDEVAGLVAYLASEEAAFLTGANIAINGGQHMF